MQLFKLLSSELREVIFLDGRIFLEVNKIDSLENI